MKHILYIFIIINLLAGNLFAQNTPEVPDTTPALPDTLMKVQIGEVVITGIKEQDRHEMRTVGQIKQVESIIPIEINSLKDATAIIPNYFMPSYGNAGTSPVYIRGIGSRINSPAVGLSVDQIPYFDKASFDFDLLDIESITVLRGPQGTLYGRNTMGGLIQVQTPSAFRRKETNIYLSGGNRDYGRSGASYYGRVNNKLGVSVNADFVNRGAFYTNTYDTTKVGKVTNWNVRTKLEWKINDRLSAKLMLSYEKNKQDGFAYAQYDKATQQRQPVNYNLPSSYCRDMATTGLVFEYKGKGYLVQSISSYQYLKDELDVDQDYSRMNLFFSRTDQKQNMFSQEFVVKSDNNKNWKWMNGIFGFGHLTDNVFALDYEMQRNIPIGLLTEISTSDHRIGGASAYHQSSFENLFIENLTLTAGIRLDYEASRLIFDKDSIRVKMNQTFRVDSSDNKLDYFEFLPKIGLAYKFSDNQSVWGSVTKGYKSGGFNTNFERPEDISFKPEYSWNYEIGGRTSLFNGNVALNYSLFYIDWRHQQVYEMVPSGKGPMLKNAGHSANKGFEIDAFINVVENLYFTAAYGYTHATYLSYSKEGVSYNKNFIPFVPRYTMSASANYRFHFSKPKKRSMLLTLEYQGIGRHYWSDANDFKQRSYGLLNAKAAFETRRVKLEVWGKNLLSKDYNTFGFETQMGTPTVYTYVQKGKPLLCGVNLFIKLKRSN